MLESYIELSRISRTAHDLVFLFREISNRLQKVLLRVLYEVLCTIQNPVVVTVGGKFEIRR